MSTLRPEHILTIAAGPQEIAIVNLGSGSTKYVIKMGSEEIKQELSGTGAMQTYENVTYPIKIANHGPNSIQVN